MYLLWNMVIFHCHVSFSKELPFFSIISLNRVPADRPRPEATPSVKVAPVLAAGGFAFLFARLGWFSCAKLNNLRFPTAAAFHGIPYLKFKNSPLKRHKILIGKDRSSSRYHFSGETLKLQGLYDWKDIWELYDWKDIWGSLELSTQRYMGRRHPISFWQDSCILFCDTMVKTVATSQKRFILQDNKCDVLLFFQFLSTLCYDIGWCNMRLALKLTWKLWRETVWFSEQHSPVESF